MKLSIVIPIYKAERWIGRCLDSIFTQGIDESEYEVVCVIDGSPDKSAEVVGKYMDIHGNIRLIEQENQGVSIARNNGVEASGGDYLTFIDSDDVFIDDSLSLSLKAIESCKEDVVVCRSFVNNSEWPVWNNKFKDGEIVESGNALKRGFLHGSVWGCYYKRELVVNNGITFPIEVSNGEDNFFFLSVMYYSKNIKFKDIKLYRVIEEEDSLSRTFSKERIDRSIKSLDIMKKMIYSYPSVKDHLFILQYIPYTCLSGLVTSVLDTRNVGLLYLLKAHVCNYTNFEISDDIVYLRSSMRLMKWSFLTYYISSFVKHKLLRK